MEFKTKGNCLYAEGKIDQAIAVYSQGIDHLTSCDNSIVKISTASSSPPAEEQNQEEAYGGALHLLYANRSMLHLKLSLVGRALQDAQQAIEVNPRYGKGYARRAAVLLDLFRFPEALADLKKAEELDPQLADGLRENKLRATRVKWVPNCYLRAQLERQAYFGCDYVLRLEMGYLEEKRNGDPTLQGAAKGEVPQEVEGDIVEEPLNFSREFQGNYVRDFKQPIETGQGTERMLYFLFAESTNLKAQEKTKDEEEGEGEGSNWQRYKLLLKRQLQREFGPDKEFNLDFTPPSTTLSYSLFHGNLLSEKVLKIAPPTMTNPNTLRMFFPGSPRWIKDESQVKEYAAALSLDKGGEPLDPTMLQAIATQLNSYREKKFGPRNGTTTTNQSKFSSSGPHHPNRCVGCQATIYDPDPSECLCGEQCCGYDCHQRHWIEHKNECVPGMAKKSGLLRCTMTYWDLVGRGLLPCKEEPDYVAMWKTRQGRRGIEPGLSSQLSEGGDDELLEHHFYLESETRVWSSGIAFLSAEIAAATDGSSGLTNQQMQKQKTLHVIREHFGKWTMKMTHILKTDSCARIKAKFQICEMIHIAGIEFEAQLTDMNLWANEANKKSEDEFKLPFPVNLNILASAFSDSVVRYHEGTEGIRSQTCKDLLQWLEEKNKKDSN